MIGYNFQYSLLAKKEILKRDLFCIMNFSTFTAQFKRNMQRHLLWQHPFFQIIQTRCSLPILQEWAIQAGHIDEVFAEVLRNMVSNPIVPMMMLHSIMENLDDELGNGNPAKEHFTLFKNVLRVLGVSESRYRKTPLNYGTKSIIRSLLVASQGRELVKILSLMASEELICPVEFPILLEKMREIKSEGDYEYFDVHITADVGHSEDLMRLCYEAVVQQGRFDMGFFWQDVDLENNVLFYDSLMETAVLDTILPRT